MDVPEDIREAARKIAETVRTYRHNASQWEMVRDAAAQALLSERLAQKERDAKIADARCAHAQNHYKGAVALKLRREIPAAIRQS